jgi:adenylyl-sulfate kinase
MPQNSKAIRAALQYYIMIRGCTIWLTGLPGAGKTTLSNLLAQRLSTYELPVEVLDADVLRTTLCKGLGFSRGDREENVRRIGFVCEILARHEIIAIVAAISPFRNGREEVRSRIARFVEVYVQCPLHILVQRDSKGLYRRALAGDIPEFTGISDPYEPPTSPEVIVDSFLEIPDQSVAKILAKLNDLDIIQLSSQARA